MFKFKRIISIVLLISMVFTSNGMFTFADHIGETIFEGQDSDKKNYYFDEQYGNGSLSNNGEKTKEEETTKEETTTEEETTTAEEAEEEETTKEEPDEEETTKEELGEEETTKEEIEEEETTKEEPDEEEKTKEDEIDKETTIEAETTTEAETATDDIIVEEATVSSVESEEAIDMYAEGEESTKSNADEVDMGVVAASESVALTNLNDVSLIDILASESEVASKSNQKRRMDGESLTLKEIQDKYFGKDKFYVNSNEWNVFQKQLFEFHKIREAWQYIYENRSGTKEKVDLMVMDSSIYEKHKNDNVPGLLNDGNKHTYYFQDDGSLNAEVISDISKAPRDNYLHGSKVISIIGDEFKAKGIASASKISGIASGYNNDLISIIPAKLNNNTSYNYYNVIGLPFFILARLNKRIRVVNCSFDWVLGLKEAASIFDQLYNGPEGSVNVDCGMVKVNLDSNRNIRRMLLPLYVYAVGNDFKDINYNHFDNYDKETKKQILQFIDNGTVFVGGLQSTNNDSYNFDSSSIKYDDCKFYFESSDKGELIDIYACQNNITDFSDERAAGTSFAAPVVSGVVALMCYINPNLNPVQIKNILYKTSDKINEKFTNDNIKVLNALEAVKEADLMQKAGYAPNKNEVFFKGTKFIMNDRGNVDKRDVNANDYIENSIMLPHPYFNDCRIDDLSKYKWEIKTVDGNSYSDFKQKFGNNVLTIEDGLFVVDKNFEYIGKGEDGSYVVVLQYVDDKNDPMYEIDKAGNKIDSIQITIYPNEHILKQSFRRSEYALGANALINPYKVVSSLGNEFIQEGGVVNQRIIKPDSFAKTNFNYDKIKIGYKFGGLDAVRNSLSKVNKAVLNYNDELIKLMLEAVGNSFDDIKNAYNTQVNNYISSMSNVLKISDNRIEFLPYTTKNDRNIPYKSGKNYSIYKLLQDYIYIYGINEMKAKELTEEYIGINKNGFSSPYKLRNKGKDNPTNYAVEPNIAYNQYPYLVYKGIINDDNKNYLNRFNYVLDDGRYVPGAINITIEDNKTKFSKLIRDNQNVDKVLTIPFSNILYTKDHYNGLDPNSNFKEIVVIPDSGNNEEIIATDSFTVKRIKKLDNTYEYKIDEFDLIKYKKSDSEAERNLVTLKYMLFSKNANVNYASETGYTTNDKNNIISDIKVLRVNDNETNEIRKTYKTEDFSDIDAEILYNYAQSHEVRLFLERGAQDSFNKTATKLVKVKTIDVEEQPGKRNPKTTIVEADDEGKKEVKEIDNEDVANTKERVVNENDDKVFCSCACIVFDKFGVPQKVRVTTLKNLYDEAGIAYVDERGRVLTSGLVTCEHGETRILDLDDYINLENSYEIEVIRTEYKAPKQKPSDKPKRYGILYRIFAEAFYKYVKLLYGPEAERLYRELAAHDLEKHGGRLGVGTGLSCCDECKDYFERIDQAEDEYRSRKEILSFRPQSLRRRAEESGTIKYGIGTLSEAELVEIRDTLEDLGFDVEKMSADETDFKVVLEKFMQDMLSDNVISFDDYAKYLKVDLTEYIPTASEIVDKNFVSFVDKKGKAINECYLDELVEKVDIELSEPENIVKDKAYAINIDKKTTGYLYKYKAPNTGNYSIVSFNNGEADPYLELYTVKNGELVEGTYASDNDSLYNKNGIISKNLNRGEEIYIRCSINGEGVGNYSISVIDDKGKKPIIGDNYSNIKLISGEYYLYNDLQKSGSIVIETSDVKLDLNGKKIETASNDYVFDVKTSKLQLSNGQVINRSGKKGIVLLERLSLLEILDGYYNGEIDEKSNQVMPITNGKISFINEDINVNSLSIKGGYFTSAKLKDYVGNGVKSKSGSYTYNGDTYTYKVIPYRAITENDFGKTLLDGEYYLDKDITSGNSSIFTSGDVSIDLKGKTLRGTRTWYSTIEVRSGTLNIKNGTIVSDYGYDICVCRGANLNVESGNYYASGNYDSVWGGNDGAGKIMVNGGSFSKMPSKYEVKKGYEIAESQTVVNNLVLKYKLDKAEYIKDIKIGGKGQSFSGYTKVAVDLNNKTKGEKIYLWYNTTNNKSEAIKNLKLTFNESGANIQELSGYTKLNYNLNNKAGGDNIYLWYTKNGSKPIRRIEIESFNKSSENKSNWNTAQGNRNYKYTYTKTEYKNETRKRTVAVTRYRTEKRTVWRTVQKVVWKKVKSFFGFFKALFTWKWKQYIEYVREPVTTYVQVPYTAYVEETYTVRVPVTKTYTETRTDNTYYGDLNKKAGGDYIYIRYQY